ncbi:MAG: hypothetical protein M0R06_26240 [Sphaerochaeta sp.]|nr:hypothetical protein [Sphaerochaeta sp.]
MANCGDRICAIADTTGTVRTSDDPTNNGTPLSTSITPPNSTYTITDMVDDPNGNTLMMKQDGPYIVVDDTASPSIPDTLSDVNTTDSYKGYVWKGYWYVPGGVNKLRRQNLSTDTVEDISITQYAQGDKDMDGKVTAIAGDGEYLYLAIDNGTYTEIIAGRDENVDGSTSWVWHPIWHVTPDDFVSMCVSAVSGSKKLYALTNTYTDGVQVFALSQSYSDPLIEASYEVTTSGTFVTPWYSTDFVENDKFWDSVWIGAINFHGYTSLRVSYQLEGQGEWDDTNDWTELGYCTASDMFSGTGATLVYPPEQVTRFSIGQTSRKIRFKFDLKAALDGSTTDEYSPVLTRIRVDGRVESSLAGVSLRKKNIACVLDLSGGPQSSVKGQLTALAALEAATEPIDFEGPDCIPRKVRFAQEGLETRLTRRPAEAKEAEFVAMLTLEEV